MNELKRRVTSIFDKFKLFPNPLEATPHSSQLQVLTRSKSGLIHYASSSDLSWSHYQYSNYTAADRGRGYKKSGSLHEVIQNSMRT